MVSRSRHAARSKELFFVNKLLSSQDHRCTANAEIIGKGLFPEYWYSRLSHNAYGRAGRKVMQFRGYAGLELECIM